MLELTHKAHELLPGYWGAPTSSVDWCEPNYVVSPYLCEFFNTISSLAMLAAGLLGLCLHRSARLFERRFQLAFLGVSVVGVGSVLFHATLGRYAQMMDELPMVYTVLLLFFILIEVRYGRQGAWLRAALAAYAALATLLVSGTTGSLQFYCFHLGFGALEFLSLGMVFLIYWRHRGESREIRWLFRWGGLSYLLAIACWQVDTNLCARVDGGALSILPVNLQFHAWWHVLCSIGLYFLCVLIMFRRAQAMGRRPLLRFFAGVVPRVVFHPDA